MARCNKLPHYGLQLEFMSSLGSCQIYFSIVEFEKRLLRACCVKAIRLSCSHNMTTLLQHVHKNMDYLQTAKCNESITKQDVIDQMTNFNVSIVHSIVVTVCH